MRSGDAASEGAKGAATVVKSIAKITAGDGYSYLIRHTAHGDAGTAGARDAAAYYTAQGNPPGVWIGRGTPVLGVAGQQVTEEQMKSLFGYGEHPDGDAIISAYIETHVRAGMTGRQLKKVRDGVIARPAGAGVLPLTRLWKSSISGSGGGWRRSGSRPGGSRPRPRRRGCGARRRAGGGRRWPGSTSCSRR